jgi:hypothetical protein
VRQLLRLGCQSQPTHAGGHNCYINFNIGSLPSQVLYLRHNWSPLCCCYELLHCGNLSCTPKATSCLLRCIFHTSPPHSLPRHASSSPPLHAGDRATAAYPLYICSTHRLARLLHAALLPASMHARAAGPCHLVKGSDCDTV